MVEPWQVNRATNLKESNLAGVLIQANEQPSISNNNIVPDTTNTKSLSAVVISSHDVRAQFDSGVIRSELLQGIEDVEPKKEAKKEQKLSDRK